MSPRTTIAFILASVLQLVFLSLPAQAGPETAEAEATSEAVESVVDTNQRLPFDPALIGLRDFPHPLVTHEDFAQAQALIEARLAVLAEREPAEQPGFNSNAGENGSTAGTETRREPDDVDRIAPLQALLFAVHQGAALAALDRELDDSLSDQEAQLAKIQAEGLGITPPYPIALLDQLTTEHALKGYSNEMLDQRRAQAKRQVDLSANHMAAVMRERRALRDRLAAAEDNEIRRTLEPALDVARINTLVAVQQHDNAVAQERLIREEDALNAVQLDLLERKIALVREEVEFAPEALESRLAEVQSRESALLERIDELASAGEGSEAALFHARQRIQENLPKNEREVLQERVNALEEELKTTRKGIEYSGQLSSLANTARTLLNRRFAVYQEIDREQWSIWLRETQDSLREIDKDRDFSLAELSALNTIELALSRRIAAPDLDPGVREAIERRVAAIDVQSQLAREILLIQDQVRSLAQRLRLDLEPQVRKRSLDQRVTNARERLAGWWNAEIAVVQDHGIYVRDAVTALSVFVLVFVFEWFVQLLLRRRLGTKQVEETQQGESQSTLRTLFSLLVRNTSQVFLLVVAFYAAMSVSGLGAGKLQEWLKTLLVLVLYFQIGIWANAAVVDFFRRKRSRKERDDPSAVTGYGLLLFFLRVGIWMMVGVSVLAYFKYPIAGLIGALGVGGIAVAFAVQNILSDVFNSMAIILDKPFRVGDFVVAGETIGVVEHIGVKTTRIRSLSGEQVVRSNTDLLGSCIHNYKHMRERRVVFKLGVVYDTPADKLELIPRIITEIVRAQPHARFDRAHFFEYGDYSLVFEIVYHVYGADYAVYMDTQQAINLAIYRRFQAEGIRFAYPTQELIVRRSREAPADA